MENGAVRIDPLTPAVAFGRVSVVTAVGAIDTNGLVAQSLLLRAGIGAIKAQANVSHDLFVDTGAGSVLADIRFLDDATAARRGSGASQDGDDAPRTAHISSSGGLIGGSVAGYRSLQVLGGTAPITLSLDPLHGAATSLDSMAGASRLEFAPGYNGRFNARTSLGRVSVVGHDVHFDPPGGGLPIPDRAASGYVGPLDTAKSSVLASATLGLITLTFA
nr:hypothetical protein HK105_006754 [Polyrhizophydium stewartii]